MLAHTSSSPHWQSSVQARLCLLHEHRLVHFIGADGLVAPQAHLTTPPGTAAREPLRTFIGRALDVCGRSRACREHLVKFSGNRIKVNVKAYTQRLLCATYAVFSFWPEVYPRFRFARLSDLGGVVRLRHVT